MTPKEKAEELVKKFRLYLGTDAVGEEYYTSDLDAKRCALIAIDELSKFLIDSESEDFNLPDEFSIQYWQEVKQEIEKL